MGIRRALTLEQLVKFCSESRMYKFNSNDSGYKVVVDVPANLIYEEQSDSKNLYVKVKVCHTLLNRNGSFISEENMKKAMPSLQEYVPLLGYIHQLDDGTYDFHAHDVEYVTDEDGNERIVYLEKQIGTFTVDEPYLEYDEEHDKTYVVAIAAIPKEYTMAADIIKRKGGTKVSCELEVSEFFYNAKEKRLEIEDFAFTGVTALGKEKNGTEIGEGMLGSRADIIDFSLENKDNPKNENFDEKLIDTLEKLNTTLAKFNIDNGSKEGGKDMDKKFEELLAKYSKTKEDIDFDYSEMTEEELEAKFKELFDEESGEASSDDEGTGSDEGNGDGASEGEGKSEEQEFTNKYTVEFNGKVRTFEVSLNDKLDALHRLVNDTYIDDDAWYSVKAYDTYVVMVNYWDDKAYKQSYEQNGDSFSLTGERTEVYANWLTKEEEIALNALRTQYAEVEAELDKYKKAEEDAKKEEIFADESYSEYLETEEFKSLIEKKDEYSVEELKDKAEIAFAKCVKKAGNFSFAEKDKPSKRHGLFSKKDTKEEKKPYGNLFDD